MWFERLETCVLRTAKLPLLSPDTHSEKPGTPHL